MKRRLLKNLTSISLPLSIAIMVLLMQGYSNRINAQVQPLNADRPAVVALVKSLSDPSNDVRANAAEKLRHILAADPSLAPNWHDKDFWTKRVEKIAPGTLLKDALAILLPEMTPKEQEAACEAGMWSGGSGVSMYRLDDYWRVTFSLKDYGAEKLIRTPVLEDNVRQAWIKPAEDYTGVWDAWYVNGRKANEIHYRTGKYDGTFTAYFDNGAKCYEQHYQAGVCNGPDTGWYKSGSVQYQGQYNNGKQDGIWRHWYENNDPSISQEEKNDKLNGTYSCWPHKGLRSVTNYKNGQRDGIDSEWDESGKQLWMETYTNGKRFGSP
jgi:antitoxin component YwqK of YwqJK toxin-antitoxin module